MNQPSLEIGVMDNQLIFIQFDQPVKFIAFDAGQARAIGEKMLAEAERIERFGGIIPARVS